MTDCQSRDIGIDNPQLLLPIAVADKPVSVMPSFSNDVQSVAVQDVQSIAHAVAVEPSVTRYINAAIADNTRRAYQQDLRDFLRWGGGAMHA